MSPPGAVLGLEAQGYRLRLAPARGATLLSLDWHHPDRGWIPVLEPLVDPEGFGAGCFIMAPFANRIADGRFVWRGEEVRLPLNRPEEGMAIHGHARDRPWRVVAAGPSAARLLLRVEEPGLPWRFDLALRLDLSREGVGIALAMTNRGDRPLPFGFGLHPWFRKPAGATLAFRRAVGPAPDARGLPGPESRAVAGFAPGAPGPLAEMPWFDGTFPAWSPARAEMLWPEEGMALTLAARGALRHLHVYVPDDRPVFCAEPVSHLPDAVNRPWLAAMDVLAPGQALRGRATLAARRIGAPAG